MVVGPRRMMIGGMIGLAITTAAFLAVDLTTDLWWIRGIMFLRGVGMACALVSTQVERSAEQIRTAGRIKSNNSPADMFNRKVTGLLVLMSRRF